MSESEKTDVETQTETETPSFTMKPVRKKPTRNFTKGSKYDPILDQFIAGKNKLVAVTYEELDGNYLRTQLNNRISAREISGIKVSVVNNVCYLERV